MGDRWQAWKNFESAVVFGQISTVSGDSWRDWAIRLSQCKIGARLDYWTSLTLGMSQWQGHFCSQLGSANENHQRNQQRNYNIVDFSPVAKNGINMDKLGYYWVLPLTYINGPIWMMFLFFSFKNLDEFMNKKYQKKWREGTKHLFLLLCFNNFWEYGWFRSWQTSIGCLFDIPLKCDTTNMYFSIHTLAHFWTILDVNVRIYSFQNLMIEEVLLIFIFEMIYSFPETNNNKSPWK